MAIILPKEHEGRQDDLLKKLFDSVQQIKNASKISLTTLNDPQQTLAQLIGSVDLAQLNTNDIVNLVGSDGQGLYQFDGTILIPYTTIIEVDVDAAMITQIENSITYTGIDFRGTVGLVDPTGINLVASDSGKMFNGQTYNIQILPAPGFKLSATSTTNLQETIPAGSFTIPADVVSLDGVYWQNLINQMQYSGLSGQGTLVIKSDPRVNIVINVPNGNLSDGDLVQFTVTPKNQNIITDGVNTHFFKIPPGSFPNTINTTWANLLAKFRPSISYTGYSNGSGVITNPNITIAGGSAVLSPSTGLSEGDTVNVAITLNQGYTIDGQANNYTNSFVIAAGEIPTDPATIIDGNKALADIIASIVYKGSPGAYKANGGTFNEYTYTITPKAGLSVGDTITINIAPKPGYTIDATTPNTGTHVLDANDTYKSDKMAAVATLGDYLRAAAINDNGDAIVGGHDTKIYVMRSGQTTFTPITTTGGDIYWVDVNNNGDFIASSGDGKIYVMRNGQTTFTPIVTVGGLDNQVAVNNNGDFIAASGDKKIYIMRSGQTTFTPIAVSYLVSAVDVSDSGDFIAGDVYGNAYIMRSGQTAFTTLTLTFSSKVLSVAVNNNGDFIASDMAANINVMRNGQTTFTKVLTAPSSASSVDVNDNGDFIVGTSGGQIYVMRNGQTTFTMVTKAGSVITSVAVNNKGDFIAGGYDKKIYIMRSGQTTFTVETAAANDIKAVDVNTGGDFIAASMDRKVYRN